MNGMNKKKKRQVRIRLPPSAWSLVNRESDFSHFYLNDDFQDHTTNCTLHIYHVDLRISHPTGDNDLQNRQL